MRRIKRKEKKAGFCPVSPAMPVGQIVPRQCAGLAPGYVGLYRFNVSALNGVPGTQTLVHGDV